MSDSRAAPRWLARLVGSPSAQRLATGRPGDAAALSLSGLGRPAALAGAKSGFQPAPGIIHLAKVDASDAVFCLFFADLIGGILTASGMFQLYAVPRHYDRQQLWLGVAAFIPVWIGSAWLQKLYAARALLGSFRQLLLRTLATFATTFGLMLFLGFGGNLLGSVSRVWLLAWAGAVLAAICIGRVGWRLYLHHLLRGGATVERALVLAGTAEAAARVAHRLAWESDGHVGVAALAALPGVADAPSLDWVEEAVRGGRVDRVVIGDFGGAMTQANAVLARLTRLAVDVTVLPDLEGLQAPVLAVERIGTLPAVELDYHPLSPLQVRLKRAEDLILASLALVFVAPVLLVAALAILLDSRGPVFFRQPRAGFNGRTFRVWKFRSMFIEASDERCLHQTARGDARVTRVGRFLRRTSIDELPQLFNVLVGDMSIVGPRPHALGMTAVGLPLDQVIEEYTARHRLKPGITGWAQVNGSRGAVDSHDKLRRRVALDCFYIERWSLAFDLWIILRTALLLCTQPNAD